MVKEQTTGEDIFDPGAYKVGDEIVTQIPISVRLSDTDCITIKSPIKGTIIESVEVIRLEGSTFNIEFNYDLIPNKVSLKFIQTLHESIIEKTDQDKQKYMPERQNCPECGAPAREWWPFFVPNEDEWFPDGRGYFICSNKHHHAWFYDGGEKLAANEQSKTSNEK